MQCGIQTHDFVKRLFSNMTGEKLFKGKALVVGLWFAGLLLLSNGAGSQTREELEQTKQSLEQEIRMTNQLLMEARQTAEASLTELMVLNTRIDRREQLLGTIQNEIRLIDRRITNLTTSILHLEEDLEALKESYSRMIRHAARNRDAYQRMMFVFSSRSFNQAYLRMRYLQQYARHRQQQAANIQATQKQMNSQVAELEAERERQQSLLARQRNEVRSLSREMVSQKQSISRLKQREQSLLQQLQEQEQAALELQNAIRRVIEEEQQRAREQAAAEGRDPADLFALTPEEQLISDNFAHNMGRLPWPLERGVITSPFGEQDHPVLPGIKTTNNGVDISTQQHARARAVFDGVVSRIITVPGGFYAVIVRHGEYRTVYSNLSEVFVSNGQAVSPRQELGVVGTNQREATTMLHLQIWKGNDKVNPAEWIARQQ